MKQYLLSLSDTEFKEFLNSFYAVIYSPQYDYRYIEYNDFTSLLTILYYVEAIVTRYDSLPYDGVLDFAEARKAFNTFRVFYECR
ncbi:MAG: hypothetical protein R2827_02890 [Bdellovibrionales bacterium]